MLMLAAADEDLRFLHLLIAQTCQVTVELDLIPDQMKK